MGSKKSKPVSEDKKKISNTSGASENTTSPTKNGGDKENANKPFNELYTLGKELGKGNYSVVRLATNNKTKEQVAVKCIIKKKLTKEDEDALKIEVAVLKEVNHPSIIKLFGFFEDPYDYYLATELMSGGELFDRIVKKEFYTEYDAQVVVRTLAECIKYLHNKEIVHRDLKPENILLKDNSDNAAVKIADFGFARHIGDGCKTACGTPGYVAPEIINGKIYGKSVDIWSLGVITFILLCGYPPFYNTNQNQLFKQIREGKFVFDSPYWDPISTTAKSFINGMLTVDLNKRMKIDDVLTHEWMSSSVSKDDITPALQELKKFNARRKLRVAIHAAIATNKMQDIAANFKDAHKGKKN